MSSCSRYGENDGAEENETKKSSACYADPLSGGIEGIKTCGTVSESHELGKGAATLTVVRI